MNIIRDFLKSIVKVILFPFRFVIAIVEEVGKNICPKCRDLFVRILKIFMNLLEVFVALPEHFVVWFKTLIRERQITRKSQNSIDALKNALMANQHTFFHKGIHYFILLATTGLQFISFFTTFAGTNYYFGNITKPSFLGPFIITCVIQFSVLFLSNGIVQKDRMGQGKKGMLAFFLFVSIMFSYTGMIHTIVTPHKEMKTNYEDFITKYDEVYHIYQAQFNVDENVSTYVSSKYQQLSTMLKNEIATVKAKRDSTPKNANTSQSSNTFTDREGQTTTSSSQSQTINNEWTKYNNQYTTLTNIQKDLQNTYQAIQSPLSSAMNGTNEETILSSLRQIEGQNTFISTFNYCVDTLNSYYQDNQLTSELAHLDNFETIYYRTLSLQTMKSSQCLTYEQIEQKIQDQTQMTAQNSNIEYLSLIANEIDEEISAFEKTPLYLDDDLTEYGISQDQLTALRTAANTAKHIEDFNVLAFGYFRVGHPQFSKAIITFIFAMFIDLTTFLMPFFMEKRKKNVLFMKKKKDILYDEEALIERLIESVYPLHDDFSVNAVRIQNELKEFIGLFEMSSHEAMEDGFSLQCEASALDAYFAKQKNMTGFMVALLNCHYLYKDSEHIYHDETMYYLRTRLVLWIHNALAALSQYIYQYGHLHERSDEHVE